MFRMDNYLERWAMKYKLLSHKPEVGSKGKRFYRIDAITSVPSFLANLVNAGQVSLAYVTQYDAVLAGQSEKFLMREHRVFVLVKQQGVDVQNGVTEEMAATDAKTVGAEVAQDLLAYIYNDWKKNKNKELEGIDFKGAAIFSTPQMFNGWWPTEVTFSQLVPRNLCVNPEKYYEV